MKTSRIRSTLLREVGNLRSSPRSALPSPPSSTLLEGRSSDFNGCSALHVQLIAILQAVSPKLLLGTLRILQPVGSPKGEKEMLAFLITEHRLDKVCRAGRLHSTTINASCRCKA